MALGVRLPSGTFVNTEDLPLGVWEGVARAGGLEVREWPTVALSPASYPTAAVELIAVCARYVGEDEPSVGYLTLGNLAEVFAQLPEDLPEPGADGTPDPKAEGDLETNS